MATNDVITEFLVWLDREIERAENMDVDWGEGYENAKNDGRLGALQEAKRELEICGKQYRDGGAA